MIINIILNRLVVLVSETLDYEHKSNIKRFIGIITLCFLIKKTQWYSRIFVDTEHQVYPDNTWYRTHNERNFDVVVLGSSGAKWAFDFSNLPIKAMNWAQQPQTLVEDFNLLRCYHSILCKGGNVIITIMPFTGLNKETGLMDAVKYLKIDTQGEPIQPYLYKKACRYANYPILFGKPAIKALIKFILRREETIDRFAKAMVPVNAMNAEQLDRDAKRWIDGWKRQFSIADFDAPLTPQNMKGREYRISVMRDLVDFCVERGYRPVYVIPPVTKHLAKYYTRTFEQNYIYSYLKEVNREVLILDYSKESDLQKDELYFNSFFLNAMGRKVFTKRVLDDLHLVEC